VRGADFDAGGAENAFPQIERNGLAGRPGDRVGGADFDAGDALIGAFGGVDAEGAAVAVGERRGGSVGKGDGLKAALEAMANGVKSEHNQRSKAE